MITSTTSTEEAVVIGLGEMRVTASPSAVLVCLGLGSCVALCVADPVAKVGGMAHIVLPSGVGRRAAGAKYADQAVPSLLEEMEHQGAVRSRLKVWLAGGAAMVKTGPLGSAFKIGEDNVAAIRAALKEAGIPRITGSDTGGTHGRTVRLWPDTGRVVVSAATRGDIEL